MFSGGVGSWAAAKRAAELHGTDDLVLLFADTLIEDGDLYRFLDEAAENIRAPLVKIAEGRDPWQVFFDKRFLGNTRIDPCSAVLKREFMRRWLEENRDPKDTIAIIGYDWEEQHRIERAAGYWEPWKVEAPLAEAPYVGKDEAFEWLEAEGLESPALYAEGFAHNNCGGFCVKAGQAQFELLLRSKPELYRYHEGREQEFREFVGKDVSILRDRRGGAVKPLTLRAFRERIEGNPSLFDHNEWGACSCMEPNPATDQALALAASTEEGRR